MTTKLCKNCEKSLAVDAKRCPYCGIHNPAKDTGPADLAIVLVLMLILLLVLGAYLTASKHIIDMDTESQAIDEQNK